MQSGFDPPPPPGGNPPPGPTQADPSQGGAFQQPPAPPQQAQSYAQQQQPYPQQQQQQPYPQQQPGYAQQPYPQNPYGQQHPYMPPQNYVQPAPGYGGGYSGYGYLIPTDGKATASLVLGILSFMCFSVVAGIPAIILGVLARRDIARSGGQLQGSGVALGGMILGGISVVILVVYVIAAGAMFMTASHATSGIPTAYPTSPFVIPTPPPTATATGAVAATTFHGSIKVVSLAAGRPLQDQLVDLRSDELAAGRTTIVETTAARCTACIEIASTFDDPLLQRALDKVTVVEVDTDEFGSELADLKMQMNAMPFFFKIDSAAHATDAISGDEWDENTPANEAPVLGAFAKGTLKKRRHPSPVGTAL